MNNNRRQFIKRAAICSTIFPLTNVFGASKEFPFETILENFSQSWKRSKTYPLEIGEAMPEKDYDFRPVPEIRSFAEQVLHLANSIYGFSAIIKGEKVPVQPNIFEAKGKSKKEIIEVLTESLNYSTSAIEDLNEKRANQTVPWGGRLYESLTEIPIWGVVRVLHDHTTHHRGQMVIYLRLKGFEPPTYVD